MQGESSLAPVKRAARWALSCPRDEKLVAKSTVIEELLIANHLGLAYQLARCMETRGERHAVISARLIRAILFSRVVQNADGEIGVGLQEDLKSLASDWRETSGNDSSLAFQLFLRSASLTPALVLTDSSVGELLRSFPLIERQPQLSNLCIKVALASRRLAGKAKSVFATSMSATQWHRAWTGLRTEIREWIHQKVEKRFRYQTARLIFLQSHWTVTPTTVTRHPEVADRWAFWQAGLTKLHSELSSLLTDQPLQRRNQVMRLLQSLREESAFSRSSAGEESSRRFAEFRQLQQSAIVLIERWIRLVDRHPDLDRYLSQDAVDLRLEVQKRTTLIDRECHEFGSQLTDRLVLAGVECCRQSVLSLQERVIDSSLQNDREPSPSRLLAIDLLRIPQLVLDQHWLPLATAERLEKKLLETLATGLPDWQTALAYHRELGNQKAARRIEVLLSSANQADMRTFEESTEIMEVSEFISAPHQVREESTSQAAHSAEPTDESAWIWDFENA